VHDVKVVLEHPREFRPSEESGQTRPRDLEETNDIQSWRAVKAPTLEARIEHQQAAFAELTQLRLGGRRITISESLKLRIEVDGLVEGPFPASFREVIDLFRLDGSGEHWLSPGVCKPSDPTDPKLRIGWR
jgi:hypothetical protein